MRLDFDAESPDRFVEFEFQGREWRMPKALTLSSTEIRLILDKETDKSGDEKAYAILCALAEKAGMTAETLEEMPKDMLFAINRAAFSETGKK